jgi:hypothetical protein
MTSLILTLPFLILVADPTLSIHERPTRFRIFDCFLYHSEAYMLYLHLQTLTHHVDKFIIGHSNVSFTSDAPIQVSYYPFEPEIRAYSSHILFLPIDILHLPLSRSLYRNATAWKREATARNFLLTGVNSQSPNPDDLILLCDVDEIPTREAITLVRQQPPSNYYNLHGQLFHYSFRWHVGNWDRPVVIRYGSLVAPLDNYKFFRIRLVLPGVLHYHCSFCFPTIREIIWKLASFSHTEYSTGRFQDPNYVYARIACGYGVLPSRWKMPQKLTEVEFDPENIYLPDDERLQFFRYRIGFEDLGEYELSFEAMREFMPGKCAQRLRGTFDKGMRLM